MPNNSGYLINFAKLDRVWRRFAGIFPAFRLDIKHWK